MILVQKQFSNLEKNPSLFEQQKKAAAPGGFIQSKKQNITSLNSFRMWKKREHKPQTEGASLSLTKWL